MEGGEEGGFNCEKDSTLSLCLYFFLSYRIRFGDLFDFFSFIGPTTTCKCSFMLVHPPSTTAIYSQKKSFWMQLNQLIWLQTWTVS